MHETHIANQLIQAARDESTRQGNAGAFKEIIVEVGELGHIPAHDLEEHFKAYPWKTTIIEKEAIVHCPACGFTGRPQILEKTHDLTLYDCPRCGKLPKIMDGHDIKLINVTL